MPNRFEQESSTPENTYERRVDRLIGRRHDVALAALRLEEQLRGLEEQLRKETAHEPSSAELVIDAFIDTHLAKPREPFESEPGGRPDSLVLRVCTSRSPFNTRKGSGCAS